MFEGRTPERERGGLKARNLEIRERGGAGDSAQRTAEAGRETSRPPAEGNGEGSLQGSLFSPFFYEESLRRPVPRIRHCTPWL